MISTGRHEHGFALIETTVTLVVAAVTVTGGLTLTYVSFARAWLHRAAYETSVCLSTPETTFNCERDLRRSTALALPVGQLESVLLSRYRNEVQTRFRWRMPTGLSLSFQDVRPIPLLGPSPKSLR